MPPAAVVSFNDYNCVNFSIKSREPCEFLLSFDYLSVCSDTLIVSGLSKNCSMGSSSYLLLINGATGVDSGIRHCDSFSSEGSVSNRCSPSGESITSTLLAYTAVFNCSGPREKYLAS